MFTTLVQNAADLCVRQSGQLQSWAHKLPDGPFDSILPAALALAQSSKGFLAAEIGVPIGRIQSCIEEDEGALSIAEHRDVGRFFNCRGIYDVRLFAWFGWRIIACHPMTTVRENDNSLKAQTIAGRIVQFQHEAGLRL